ncbi:MAG: adenylosuccinate lyase, partial [Alphaproteobacteria bacterium]
QANLDTLGGLVNSQRVLLALTQAGLSREDAYDLVQKHAMSVWRDGGQLLDGLKADPEVTAVLSGDELEALFEMAYHTKHVGTIFERVFGGDS